MTKIRLLLFISLLTTLQGFACMCIPTTLNSKYIGADFVARIKIIKNHPNKGEEEIYKSDIEVLELFKGKPTTSLLMQGSSDGKKRSTCDLLFKENSEVLVYAGKNKKRVYQLYQCSDPVTKEGYELKIFERELAALRVLKEQSINYTHNSHYGTDIDQLLGNYRGIVLDKSFAIYEITFTENTQVDSIRIISGFSDSFDKPFIESLKKARWVRGNESDNVHLTQKNYPHNTIFIVLFYYESDKEYPSFIGEYNL